MRCKVVYPTHLLIGTNLRHSEEGGGGGGGACLRWGRRWMSSRAVQHIMLWCELMDRDAASTVTALRT